MKWKVPTIIFLILTIFVGSVSAQTQTKNLVITDKKEIYLLARIIHAEARGEPLTGKIAVGAVIINRVNNNKFPNTIQKVIYQPLAFTAINDGQFELEPDSESYQAALLALKGVDPTNGALFYYNPVESTSEWIYSRPVVNQIGKHVFAY